MHDALFKLWTHIVFDVGALAFMLGLGTCYMGGQDWNATDTKKHRPKSILTFAIGFVIVGTGLWLVRWSVR